MSIDAAGCSGVPWLPMWVEQQRQAVVDDVQIDPLLRSALSDITWQAAHLSDSPMAAVTILDRDRQVLEAGYGISTTETSRQEALCNWTIAAPLEVTVFGHERKRIVPAASRTSPTPSTRPRVMDLSRLNATNIRDLQSKMVAS